MAVKDNIEIVCDILEDILRGYDIENFSVRELDFDNYEINYGASYTRINQLLRMLEESEYITVGSNISAYEMRLSMKGLEFLAKYRGENDKKEDMLDILLRNAQRDKTIDGE